MKALTWRGKHDIRCETVPDPKIEEARDAIIKVTACAICGSDLHLYDGLIPKMQSGDVLGHETMGEVVEVGSGVSNLKVGDRVVVPFTIACGECFFCRNGFYSGCERTNPDREIGGTALGPLAGGAVRLFAHPGGYPGGQAEYLRVPYADVGPIKIQNGLSDEQVLFLSDIFPTGYMAADFCGHQGRRDRCDLGLRPRRTIRHSQRVPPRGRPSDRDRHGSGTLGAGRGCRRRDASTSRRTTSTSAFRS